MSATSLQQLVRETVDLTGAPAPTMFDDDAPVLTSSALKHAKDEGFYIVGLIGGKEVGKSALVNALVGEEITKQTSHGPGTHDVIAYTHASQAQALQQLLERDVPGRFRIIQHRSPHLVRQVLLDLPDIDSHWADHLEITRKMLRNMLFPIWIQSIEKYADQQPQKLLAQVAAGNDPANFMFVLNKVDQLRGSGNEEANELRDDFAKRLARTLGWEEAAPSVYLISAIHPEQFDLPSLRDAMSQQKSPQVLAESMNLAARQQDRSLLGWLDRQNLPEQAERLARLHAEASELTAERIGVPLMDEAIPRLIGDSGYRLAMADAVMNRRVRRWPIVNIVHTLLSPVMAFIRANTGTRVPASLASAQAMVEAHLESEGRPIASIVQSTFAQLQQSHPMVASLYEQRKLWESMSAESATHDLRRRLADAIEKQQTFVQDKFDRGAALFAPIRWLLTIGAVLWFPIVQPVLQAILGGASIGSLAAGAKLLVELLSATYLLKSVGFLVLYFAILWLIVRWDTQRKVSRLLARWRIADDKDADFSPAAQVMEWIDDLTAPIADTKQRVDKVIEATEAIRKSLQSHAAA